MARASLLVSKYRLASGPLGCEILLANVNHPPAPLKGQGDDNLIEQHLTASRTRSAAGSFGWFVTVNGDAENTGVAFSELLNAFFA